MSFQRLAVIMAGGSGERFWPASTREVPKQLLKLANPEISLLQESVNRAGELAGTENVFLATAPHLVAPSLEQCTALAAENALAEPHKRNTAGALVWVAASLMARYDDCTRLSLAILTADHRITPTETFVKNVREALDLAEETGGLVTIGIRPDRPETGFGYIECGEPTGPGRHVLRFREKPDLATAESFLAAGNFLWNSGMFFWTLPAFMNELERSQPEMAVTARQIAHHLRHGDEAQAAEAFASLPNISIDFAVMENAASVYVVAAEFTWDDLGSWDALGRTLPPDAAGNVHVGETRLIDCEGCIVYADPSIRVNALGLEDVVISFANGELLVTTKDRAQEVKRFLQS